MKKNKNSGDSVWDRGLEVLEAQVSAIIRESELYRTSEKSISGCGASVEIFIRDFLKTILPSRFNIKSGYIVTPGSVNPIISAQMDIVITDAFVPDSLLPFSALPGLSLIPYEAVVGIVEVKRTLTKKSVLEGYDHLQKCYECIHKSGVDLPALMLGGLRTKDFIAYKWNPFLSIISICSELSIDNELELVNKLTLPESARINFVASLDGYYIGVAKEGKPTTIEDRKREYQYLKAEGGEAIKILLKHLYFHLRQTAGAWADFNKYW